MGKTTRRRATREHGWRYELECRCAEREGAPSPDDVDAAAEEILQAHEAHLGAFAIVDALKQVGIQGDFLVYHAELRLSRPTTRTELDRVLRGYERPMVGYEGRSGGGAEDS